jgi:hypothetical protein
MSTRFRMHKRSILRGKGSGLSYRIKSFFRRNFFTGSTFCFFSTLWIVASASEIRYDGPIRFECAALLNFVYGVISELAVLPTYLLLWLVSCEVVCFGFLGQLSQHLDRFHHFLKVGLEMPQRRHTNPVSLCFS